VNKDEIEHAKMVIVALSHNYDLLAGFLKSLQKFVKVKTDENEIDLKDEVYRGFVRKLAAENPLACVAECFAISFMLSGELTAGVLVPEDPGSPYAGIIAAEKLRGLEDARRLFVKVVEENREYMHRLGGKRLAILLRKPPTFFKREVVGG